MANDLERLKRALADRYEIRSELGRGGMATVYLADDPKHGRSVALKVLRPELAAGIGADRFLHEVRVTARLDHPHILPLLDSGEADGFLYYVMPYVDGESLRDRLDREKQLPVEDALRIGQEVADALDYAHDLGVVHRDVKPGNILLASGHARVADFGVARAVRAAERSDLTATGMVAGTPVYMSPEQATGEREVGPASDVYSLACVVYEMLAGEPPHTGATQEAVLARKLVGEIPGLRVVRESVPSAAEQAVGRGLARVPADRFTSAGEFARALDRAGGRGASAPGETRGPTRRRTSVVVGAGLLLLLALGGLWLWPSTSLAFQEGDTVLVADFDNQTDDPVYEGSLDTAFRISLQQSPFLNLFSRAKVAQVLRRMRQDTEARLTREVAREVAVREGLPVVIVPVFSQVGDQFALGAGLVDPETGEAYATHLVRVDREEELLDGVDELVLRIRRTLGESEGRIFEHRKPLYAVTTGSLPALRLYSLAIDHTVNARWDDARRLYAAALEQDTTFTAARASLGMTLFEHFDQEEGTRHLTRALEESDGLTDRESFGLRAFYADAVEGDLEKAESLHRTLAEMYPNEAAPRHNLGWLYARAGRNEEAAEEYAAALRIDPSLNLSYWGLNYLLLYSFGQVDSALTLARARTQIDSTFILAWDDLGWAYLGMDSLDAAREAFQRALELDPRFISAHYRLGHIHRLQGRRDEAVASFRRALEIQPENGAQYPLALALRDAGQEAEARRHLERFRELREEGVVQRPDHAYNHIELALYHLRTGSPDSSRASLDRALAMDSLSADVRFGAALVAGAAGENGEALGHLERAIGLGFQNYIWMKIHPDLEGLRGDPAFQALLDRHLN